MNKRAARPGVLVLAGLWVLWGFGYDTALKRLLTSVDGVVVASFDRPHTGAPRYGTFYTIRSTGGHEVHYIAGASDGSLARSIPVGSTIRKRKWNLGYEINGRWVAFPVIFYSLMLSGALAAVIYGSITILA